MQTLELGFMNAGFIFLAAALLSTLIFGRFFCGWGCHIVALQDLCGWIMKKCGVRPKPFRSRLLVYAPLALALYMFVWPTVKRLGVDPLLARHWPEGFLWFGRSTPFPPEGFTNHMMTESFWATFAPPLIAVPFLLLCGFATVYFLGAKGFCTYGCPYGGLFGPIDRLSTGRIVVNHDLCERCGHCTAVCTSNVRVHEEIHEYGMVVNPGCMKCMDCVSVCPNEALAFKFAKPSIIKGKPRTARPKRVFDLRPAEEVGLAVILLGAFVSVRGAYGAIPMLMAAGFAGCFAFLMWKLWRMFRDENVRGLVLQLKRSGRWTRAGMGFAAVMVGLAALVVHTGIVNYHRARADAHYELAAIRKESLFLPGAPALPESTRVLAERGLEHYQTAASRRRGGLGLLDDDRSLLRAALLALASGRPGDTEDMLRLVARRRGGGDELTADLARVMLVRDPGRVEEAIALLQTTLEKHPEYWSVRQDLAGWRMARGEVDTAADEAARALTLIPDGWKHAEARARTRLTLARLLEAQGKPEDALAEYQRAVADRPRSAVMRENLAAAKFRLANDLPGAITEMRAAVALAPGSAVMHQRLGHLLLMNGNRDDAIETFRTARKLDVSGSLDWQGVAERLREAGLMTTAEELLAPR